MLTSIIILNWNGVEVLRPCLEAIEQNTRGEEYEVIVLDNGSTQAGVEQAVAGISNLRLIQEAVNHGFSKGNNIAARAARGDFLLILNNDTLPRPGWLGPLRAAIQASTEVGMVGARLVDARDQTIYAGSYFNPPISAYADAFRNYPSQAASKARDCDAYIGCGILMRRSVYEAVGGFDEQYFQGYEDFDLCLKVRELGLRIQYCPDSSIEHLENVSMRKLSTRRRRETKENNRLIFERRWKSRLFEFREDHAAVPLEKLNVTAIHGQVFKELLPKKVERILCVGCGSGGIGQTLKTSRQTVTVQGVDNNPHAIALAKQCLDDAEVAALDLHDYVLKGAAFDVMVVPEVLHQLDSPWDAVFRWRELLTQDGVVIASVYNAGHYRRIKKLVMGDWRYEPSGVWGYLNRRFFTLGSLQELFFYAGFDVLDTRRIGKKTWWSRWLSCVWPHANELMVETYIVVAKKRTALKKRGTLAS